MTTELTRRETQARTKAINNASVGEQIALNVASIPMNVIGGAAGLVDNISHIIQGEDINPYSRAHSFTNMADDIRGKTANDINDATDNASLPWVGTTFGDAYQSVMSFGDSVLASFFPGGHLLLASGAAEREMKDLYDRGASVGQITAGGLLAGAAEAVFEKWSIGELKSLKDVGKKVVKSKMDIFVKSAIMGGVEATEEMATEIANTISDALVMGTQSNWVDFNTFAKNVVNAGIGGFFSGGIGGGVASTINHHNYNNQVKQTGNTIKDAGQTRTLVDTAKALGSDSKAAKAASKITDKSSAYAIGKLYGLTETEISNANRGDIVKSLERKGIDAKQANRIAELMLDPENSLYQNSQGFTNEGKTYNDLIKNPNSTVNARNQGLENVLRGVAEQRAKAEISKGGNATTFADKSDFALLSKEEVSKRMADNPAFAKEYTEWAKINSSEGSLSPFVKNTAESRFKASEEGKAINTETGKTINIAEIASIKGKEMMLKTDNGETVNAKNVSYANEGDALVYSTVLDMGVPAGIAYELVRGYKG